MVSPKLHSDKCWAGASKTASTFPPASGRKSLARAYMRDVQVLILDEATASLDARAE
jgi:alpha-D-ribose 1-methylphosphonate 5-triphosphate synthase subunit PhnL